jgi:hypothetical protein
MGGNIFVLRVYLQCLMLIKTQGATWLVYHRAFPPLKYKRSEQRHNYKHFSLKGPLCGDSNSRSLLHVSSRSAARCNTGKVRRLLVSGQSRFQHSWRTDLLCRWRVKSRVLVSFLPPISYPSCWISDSLLVLRLKIPPLRNKGTKKRTVGRFGVLKASLLAGQLFWHVTFCRLTGTEVRHLTAGISSEKCVVRRFRRH